MKKIKVIGKILCLSSALPVFVFFTYYIMSSIKLGEFATVESNNNPFYDVFFEGAKLYDFFSLTFSYLILFFIIISCIIVPYFILSIYKPELRLNTKYYFIFILSFILLMTILLSENLFDWLFY